MSWSYRRFIRSSLLFVLGTVLCWLIGSADGLLPGTRVTAQSVTVGQLVQQGLVSYQSGRFPEAIVAWEKALTQATNAKERAVVYSNLGQAYRQVGRFDLAITQWERAIKIYQDYADSDSQNAVAQLLTEQAQAYGDLGQHQVAVNHLQKAIKLAQKHQDHQTEAAALGALGNAYWSLGTYDDALSAHEQSLSLACKLNNANYITTALNNLGNVFSSRSERSRFQATAASLEGDVDSEKRLSTESQRDSQIALAAYHQSVAVSRVVGGMAEARALLNLNRLLEQAPADTITPLPELTCAGLNFAALPALFKHSAKPPTTAAIAPAVVNQELLARNRNRILVLLEHEADSQEKAYGFINLANSLITRNETGEIRSIKQFPDPSFATPDVLLNQALTIATNINDGRAKSFALGTLGELYESRGQYDQAMAFTRRAMEQAETAKAADSLYRWQWQVGRLLKARGQREQAIKAYEQAIATLQSIRSDIVVANKDLQFDFRDSVEPVYRQLIALLLSSDDASPTSQAPETTTVTPKLKASSVANPPLKSATNASTVNISKVLEILELLKLAELQNFFGDDCVQVARDTATAEQSLLPGVSNEPTYGLNDSRAAVVYSVVLDDRSYMILRFPDGSLKQYPIVLGDASFGSGNKQLGTTPKAGNQLQAKIDELRMLLEKRATEEYLISAQAIYNALIRPMEADLAAVNPKTLVFINDGVLRKVPMAALHDGKQFLIEKYPIATTPSLSLTTRRPFARSNVQALILGLTVEQAPFAALPNVGVEVKGVQGILGGTELIDQAFTLERMQQRLEKNSYPIIHMATHGKFGADAASTFLVAYREHITINELDNVLRTRRSRDPVELLTLSACQTAAGDNRSALGIAGVAVRAGVKSALATLWFINDQATVPLIKEFYTQLREPNITKAEALQRAQIKLIRDREYNHPAVWSPFILIGNWL